jgi:hypothetical protein
MGKAIKNPAEICRLPGTKQFTAFIRANPDFFNLSAIERLCDFPNGTLRHIRAGTRIMQPEQYKKIQEVILPKMCEGVLLLQLYTGIGTEWDN